jgi:hypothetical protein
MRKINLVLFAVAILIATIFQSCSTSNQVVNESFIQKRKYQKGFFVNHSNKKEYKNEKIAKIESPKIVNDEIKNIDKPEPTLISSNETTPEIILTEAKSNNISNISTTNFSTENIVYKNITEGKSLKNNFLIKKALKQSLKKSSSGSSDGFALAGFIMGVLSFVTLWFSAVSLLFGVLAIIFSAIAMKNTEKKWMAITGLILGILTYVIFLAMVALVVSILM